MLKKFIFITISIAFFCTGAWAQLMTSPWPKIHNDKHNSGYSSNVGTAIGKLKWTFITEKPITSSPALDNRDRLYFGSADKYLYCLDRITGDLIWKYSTGDAIEHSSPAIDQNGILYIGSVDKSLYAFDTINIVPSNPLPLWSFKTQGGIYGSPTVADDGTIIFGSADGYLYRINPASQQPWPAENNSTDPAKYIWKRYLGIIWSTPTIDTFSNNILIGSTKFGLRPVLEDAPDSVSCGKVFAEGDTLTAHNYYRLDHATGDTLWYGPNVSSGITGVFGSIAIQSDGTLLIPTEGDGLFIGENNAAAVAVNFPADNDTCLLLPDDALNLEIVNSGSIIRGTPSVKPQGAFFLGFGNTFYSLGPSGSEYWSYDMEGPIESSAATDGNLNTYLGCNGGVFYCLNSNSPLQPLRWRYPESGNIQKLNGDAAEIISSAAIDNDDKHSIYFGASNGALYAFYDGASIKGKVTMDDLAKTPLASVVITLKDAAGKAIATTSTNTSGEFEFSGISSGQYSVLPTKGGFIFDPAESIVNLGNLDEYVPFTAATAFALTGRIVSATDGTGLPNVSLGLITRNAANAIVYSDNKTVTDATGYYTISNIGYGTSIVTPSLSGWGFNPPSVSQSIPIGTTGVNVYTLPTVAGTLGYQISGRVLDATAGTETGLANITITLSGTTLQDEITQTTDGQGVFSFTGLENGSYTITPSFNLFKFDPVSANRTINNASALDVEFQGAAGIKISGRINLTGGSTSYAGFVVNLYRDDETFWSRLFNKDRTLVATKSLSSDGSFIFMGVTAGKYIVSPALDGYSFNPAEQKITAFNDVGPLVFSAGTGFSISGRTIGLLGIPQSNITLNLSNYAGTYSDTVTTGADGSYTFTGLTAGPYLIGPQTSGFYTAAPMSRLITLDAESQRRENFIIISFCTNTYLTLPFWGAPGSVVNIIGTNFGPTPASSEAVEVTLSDQTTASVEAGVYFGTNDPATWVKAVATSWTPFLITAQVPLLDARLLRVWVVRPGQTSCINITATNFFFNSRP